MTGTGTLAAFDNITGSDQIQLRISQLLDAHLERATGPTTSRTWRASAHGPPRHTSTGRRCPATTRASSPGAASRSRAPRPGRAPAFPVRGFRVRVSPPARRRFSLRPRMAMTYRLFAPVGRFVVASTFLAACASPPPPAPGAPAAPAAGRGPSGLRRARRPRGRQRGGRLERAADQRLARRRRPEALRQRAARQHRLRGQQIRPVDDVVHGARRRQRLREGRSVLHRRHQQGQ